MDGGNGAVHLSHQLDKLPVIDDPGVGEMEGVDLLLLLVKLDETVPDWIKEEQILGTTTQ